MRLLNVNTFEFKTFFDERPGYIVLSHRWNDGEEMMLQDIKDRQNVDKQGYRKIQGFAKYVRENIPCVEWIWVDTCCVNQDSDREVSEAVNSMFHWYADADACLAYLADVDDPQDMAKLRQSVWFRRGWTLQELLAPYIVIFVSQDWEVIGYKGGNGMTKTGSKIGTTSSMETIVSTITGIPQNVLKDFNESRKLSVDERLAWIDGRQTTRAEDMSYSLFGMFDVALPVIYGEGAEKARRRLFEEASKISQSEKPPPSWQSRLTTLLSAIPANWDVNLNWNQSERSSWRLNVSSRPSTIQRQGSQQDLRLLQCPKDSSAAPRARSAPPRESFLVPNDPPQMRRNRSELPSIVFRPPDVCIVDSLITLQWREYKRLYDHKDQTWSLAFSPDGKLVASGGNHSNLSVWDVASGATVMRCEEPSVGRVKSLTFSPEGRLIACGTTSGMFLVDAVTFKISNAFNFGHDVKCIAISADGKLLARCTQTESSWNLDLWEVATGRGPQRIALPGEPTSLSFSPDGRLLAVGLSQCAGIRLLDTTTWKETMFLDRNGVRCSWIYATSFKFVHDASVLAVGFINGLVRLWNVNTGVEMNRVTVHEKSASTRITSVLSSRANRKSPISIQFSPNRKMAAFGLEDGTISLCDMGANKEIVGFKAHESVVRRVAFSPNGRILASGSDDNTVALWDLETYFGTSLRTS